MPDDTGFTLGAGDIKLGSAGEADEGPADYTDDAIEDAAGKVCAALGIEESKAPSLVRTLRPLLQLMKDEG